MQHKSLLCDIANCTGCLACYATCPHNAIEIIKDEFGFHYPHVLNNVCINCGKCSDVCPEINKVSLEPIQDVYAVVAQDESMLTLSSSGALATILISNFIKDDGLVYSHCFDDALDLICVRCKDSNLDKIRGSKYVESDMRLAFKDIISELSEGKKILFIGTPCQVAGLINCCPKIKRENLTTVSFVCGGVPSIKFFKEHIDGIIATIPQKIDDIKFRDNRNYRFRFFDSGKELHFQIDATEDLYFIAFGQLLGKQISLRESCYHCRYASSRRVGDMTIGDFWGLKYSKMSTSHNIFQKGVSLAIPTTKRGHALLNKIGSEIFIEKHDITEASLYNSRLNDPVTKSIYVDKFRKLYRLYGFDVAVKKTFMWLKLCFYLKNYIKRIPYVYSAYKFIKNKREIFRL